MLRLAHLFYWLSSTEKKKRIISCRKKIFMNICYKSDFIKIVGCDWIQWALNMFLICTLYKQVSKNICIFRWKKNECFKTFIKYIYFYWFYTCACTCINIYFIFRREIPCFNDCIKVISFHTLKILNNCDVMLCIACNVHNLKCPKTPQNVQNKKFKVFYVEYWIQ